MTSAFGFSILTLLILIAIPEAPGWDQDRGAWENEDHPRENFLARQQLALLAYNVHTYDVLLVEDIERRLLPDSPPASCDN